ncbi:MAG: hypothetical protein K5778_01715 [Bacteroidaceae bacterium]|nr:hypothetical protein [Bacteroidaceae bacterium]
MTRRNHNRFLWAFIICGLLLLLCCSCRSSRIIQYEQTDSLRVVSQTAQRHASRVADSVSVRDTVKTAVEQRGDTVTVTNTIIRWRDRVVTRTDTVHEARVDTVVEYRERQHSEMKTLPQGSDRRFEGLILCVLVFSSVLSFILYIALRYKIKT